VHPSWRTMRSNPARASGGTPAPKVRLGLPAAQEIWQERSPAPRNPQIGALPAKLLLWRSSSIPSWNEVQPRCDRGWLQIGWSRHEWKWLYLQDNDVTSWRHLPCCYPGQCCNGCFIAAYLISRLRFAAASGLAIERHEELPAAEPLKTLF
jgi:hypothetical protein